MFLSSFEIFPQLCDLISRSSGGYGTPWLLKSVSQFPQNCLPLFSFSFSVKMDTILANLQKRFPALPKNALLKIYNARFVRLKILMLNNIPEDIRWLIEAKVRLSNESPNDFVSFMPGLGRSSYAKKRRAKRLQVCHKCARWNCNRSCHSIGFASRNREDKIQFIKDGLSKESLDNILLTLETHPCGLVQRELLDLWNKFKDEHQ